MPLLVTQTDGAYPRPEGRGIALVQSIIRDLGFHLTGPSDGTSGGYIPLEPDLIAVVVTMLYPLDEVVHYPVDTACPHIEIRSSIHRPR